MNLICKITDEEFGLEYHEMNNPRTRIGARGIIFNENNEIAIFNKQKKNEYKLPGGGVDENETPEDAFIREAAEETGTKIIITDTLGTIEEHESQDNFKQVSYVFVGKVEKYLETLNLTQKEKDEGSRLIWVPIEKGLRLITECINNLKESEYDNIYHTKFMVTRDKKILEYYINQNKN